MMHEAIIVCVGHDVQNVYREAQTVVSLGCSQNSTTVLPFKNVLF